MNVTTAPRTRESFVIAIDLGTSGPKTIVLSETGRVAGSGRAYVRTLYLPGGAVEQDANEVWAAVKESIRSAMKESGATASDVRAVICASQYSSIAPVDRSGAPTMNMILWMDQRGAKSRMRSVSGFPRTADAPWRLLDWLHVHGLPPIDGGLSLTHMRFVKYALPEVYARTATFLEPMDFVTMRLVGRATTNQCTAFAFLLLDNRRLDSTVYHPRLLRYSLIDPEKLPEIVPVDAILGNLNPDVAEELGLSPQTQVVTGMNDTQAGAMGAYAFTGSHAGIAMGSSSVMVTHVGFKRTDARNFVISMPSPEAGERLAVAENGISGAVLDSFLNNCVFADDAFASGSPCVARGERYAAFEQAVREVPPGCDGLMFLPWVNGTLSPAADSRMRGGFVNIGPNVTRSHMARAVVEGIALNLRWVKGPMERFTRRTFSHFLFYGGGGESDVISQVMADVLDAPVHQMRNAPFGTSIGAGLVALQRLGMIGFQDFPALVGIRQVFEPNPDNRRLYGDRFAAFTQAFRNLRPLSHAMNRQGHE